MTNAHPNRRTPVALPSKGKHILLAAYALLLGYTVPIAAVGVFGNAEDASAEGAIALTPPPKVEVLSPLNDETLETPDLLAGEIPEGVNPTDTPPEPEEKAAPSDTGSEPKTILIPAQAITLPQAPIAGLTRQSQFGPVPSKSAGNSLLAYRRPFQIQAGKKPVSLIIGGLGVNRPLTQSAIDTLPADVTLSFAAHSVGLQDWVDIARRDGHEVLIEIPFESNNFDPAEPEADRTIRVSVPPAENFRRLEWMLSRAQGYAGITNFNGDVFLARADMTGPLMDVLSQTGLGFITDGSFKAPSLPALARTVRQPFKAGHGLIDPDPISPIISGRLSALGETAQSGSHPVGVGFAYPETLSEVQNWIATLDAQNLQLAPATAALN